VVVAERVAQVALERGQGVLDLALVAPDLGEEPAQPGEVD
jgi:hypothetical protein